MPDPAALTFFPWSRRGLASLSVDTLGAGVSGSASIAAQLSTPNAPPVTQPFRLMSPGDVTGFDPRQVISTEPKDGTRNAEPNFLATVEFDRPDFPWLFTPASADAQGRLRPWLCLIVVKQQAGVSITAGAPGLPPALDLRSPAFASAELPDPSQSWAWAHAQVAGATTPSGLDSVDAQSPERTLSRLVCPRRLEPTTPYYACVVPAFEAGRKAGLGITITDADLAVLQPAWTTQTVAIQLPIYYMWQFSTGLSGDFASLVKLLHPYLFPAGSGTRAMFAGAAGQGLPASTTGATVALESALLPLGPLPNDWTGTFADSFRAALRALIDIPPNAASDPLVTAPFYAGRHTNQLRPPAPNVQPLWLAELTLNPQFRALAAYGTRVVQDQQEPLMASAWDQAGDLRRANTMLRQAQLVRRSSEAVFNNHVAKLTSSTLLDISRPVHTRIAVAANTTVRLLFAQQHVPAAIVSRTFRSVARPRGSLMRTVLPAAQRVMRPVTSGVAAGKLIVTYLQPPFAVVTLEDVEGRFEAAGGVRPAGAKPVSWVSMSTTPTASVPQRPGFTIQPPPLSGTAVLMHPLLRIGLDSPEARNFRTAVQAHQALLGADFIFAKPPIPALNLDTIAPALQNQINPTTRVTSWVKPLVQVKGATVVADSLDPIAAAPLFPQPMYEPLRDMAPDLIVAGLKEVPDNTVSLLQANPRFVEAFLAGLNHEMARELLWRGYPTDQRGTYFPNFWDRRSNIAATGPAADIPAINTWPPQNRLGQTAAGAGNLVMLLRGEITRRYPDAIIYMVQAVQTAGQSRPSLGTQEIHPVMSGTLPPDLAFYGFPITGQDATGAGTPAKPGYFFVIQEHPCAPRFGLAPDADPGPLSPARDSAVTAQHFLQPPVRLAIHARDLLSGI